MRSALIAAAFMALLPMSASNADHTGETWVSVPRAGITIVVAKDGSRVIGPGWEHAFDAGTTLLDFEIAPERRMVLRRDGDRWVGEYFHPRVRPGNHEFELHIMTFDRMTFDSMATELH
jgi:hypothetical protein